MHCCLTGNGMYRIGFLGIILLAAIGCGPSRPSSAGGKPVEYWLEKVHDKEDSERIEAVKKLGNIGKQSPKALPAIVNALSDPIPSVRKVGIYAVVRNWPASRIALPRLEEMKEKDEDADIREIAEEAYGNLKRK